MEYSIWQIVHAVHFRQGPEHEKNVGSGTQNSGGEVSVFARVAY
jgi:hypothetical protein